MRTDAAQTVPSLVLTEGGPGDAAMRTLGLAPLPQRSRRAPLVLAAVTWLPLLVLSATEGRLLGGAAIPFLYDIGAHVRFLVAMPLLLLAEMAIGARLREVVARFVEIEIVRTEDRPRFIELVLDTIALRDSRVAELAVLAAAYVTAAGLLFTAIQTGSTWHAGDRVTPLRAWYALVSLPLFHFLVYRWIYRMFLWGRFLRRLSTFDLQLVATHPDGAAGVGFLGKACIPLGALLFALSAVTASAIATRVLFLGAPIEGFYAIYAVYMALAIVAFAGPILAFAPVLVRVKRDALLDYGGLAMRYTQHFDHKWIRGKDPQEPLLGTADIQSLADLGNAYSTIKALRVLPIGLADFVAMVIPGLVPVLPLLATVMPVRDIAKGLLMVLR